MEYKDYYATLGVSKNADAAEVQKAYRKLARQYHPDVNRSPDAEGKFKGIGEAYEVLSDPEKRARYDQYGSAWRNVQSGQAPPPGFEHFHFDFGGGSPFDLGGDTGFSSFFEMLFGSDPRGQQTRWANRRPRRSARGQDREINLVLSLEDVAHGGPREIEFFDPPSGARRKLKVEIPPGVRSGQRIRLAGQGDAGRGQAAGDLYLRVDVHPHAIFDTDGRDLHCQLAIAPWEAALGATVLVPTLNGEVEIKLPPGSSSGRKIRLRDRGLPGPGGETGALYAEIKIVIPQELTSEEKRLYQELADTSKFRPR